MYLHIYSIHESYTRACIYMYRSIEIHTHTHIQCTKAYIYIYIAFMRDTPSYRVYQKLYSASRGRQRCSSYPPITYTRSYKYTKSYSASYGVYLKLYSASRGRQRCSSYPPITYTRRYKYTRGNFL